MLCEAKNTAQQSQEMGRRLFLALLSRFRFAEFAKSKNRFLPKSNFCKTRNGKTPKTRFRQKPGSPDRSRSGAIAARNREDGPRAGGCLS
jgi:hypothetical protein